MLAKVVSASLTGLEAQAVDVEVDVARGLPRFEIVGLVESAVKEGRNRVISALQNSGFEFPARRLTVNLAPACLPKDGSFYDLPISLGILWATGQLSGDPDAGNLYVGELSLDGRLRPVRGVLPMAIFAKQHGYKRIFVPQENAAEAGCIKGLQVKAVTHLAHLVQYLDSADERLLAKLDGQAALVKTEQVQVVPDLADVQGQELVKRVLQISAAGFHHLLLVGPPGSGKSMMARRIPGLMPLLNEEASLESTRIHSVASALAPGSGLLRIPPFRAPHHTISAAGFAGGGSNPSPGEISLAHNGVLFMDEFPEFRRDVLESLRQPLESGSITICRVAGRHAYPTRVLLVAAMNPCPCGYYGEEKENCHCSPGQIHRYLTRMSGPLLDRFDLQLRVKRVAHSLLSRQEDPLSTAHLQGPVRLARQKQSVRFGVEVAGLNGCVPFKQLLSSEAVESEAEALLEQAMDKFCLSARGFTKILRVARSIADMEDCPAIRSAHVAEALQYRFLDRRLAMV